MSSSEVARSISSTSRSIGDARSIGGKQNPYPRRLFPWGPAQDLRCVNVKGGKDGYVWTAPVDAFACGDSPYGVRQLGGNVQEWIARDGQIDRDNWMHMLRGGYPDAAPNDDETTTIFRNARNPRTMYYSNGLRCVIPTQDLP